MFDKSILLKNVTKPDEKLIYAKAFDQVYSCLKNYEPRFTDFLDPYKIGVVLRLLSPYHGDFYAKVFGGYANCERALIGFTPLTRLRGRTAPREGAVYIENGQPWEELPDSDFPITLIEISYNTAFSKVLTHRDFLGAILNLGIERSKIGDIIVKNGVALVFVYHDIADYICGHLKKAAHTTVKARAADLFAYLFEEEDEEESKGKIITVSSLRMDTFLSGAFHLSRSKIAGLIQAEKVLVNWTVNVNASKNLTPGDIITIKGFGRVKFLEIASKSKKDKFVLRILKY